MNRIIILGTAGDFDAVKTGRSAGAIVIEVDGKQIIVDPGPGTITTAGIYNLVLNPEIVMISSPRLINTNDINAIAELTDKNPILMSHEDVFNHENSVLTTDHLKKFSIEKALQVNRIQSRDGNYSFVMTTTKYVIGYVYDTTIYKKSIQEFKNCNILIVRCENMDKGILFELIKETEPELVILTGYDMPIIKENPLEFSRTLKKALNATKQTNIQIIPAKDGMLITPESYNIRLKQKSLTGFI